MTLTISQIFGSVGVGIGFAVSALVAMRLSSSAGQAGLLQGISGTGTIAATILLSRISASRGRRPALALGYAVAALGALLAAAGIGLESFVIFLVGGALFSIASATNLQSRFAAGDLASPNTRASGMSLVLWMSTVGAVLGPNLATWGGALAKSHGLDPWAGAYLAAAVGFGVAALVIFVRLRPDPLVLARAVFDAPEASESERQRDRQFRTGLVTVFRSTETRFILAAMVVAHAVMVGVMSWSPVHMAGMAGGHGASSQAVIGYVLSAHLVGMYAFSPLVGWAASRFGEVRVILAGALILATSVAGAARLPASDGLGLGFALIGLGVGWAAMFIASSSLLTSSVPVERRASVQGVGDAAIWTASGVSLVVSGWVLGTHGFPWLCYGCLALLVPVAIWAALRARARRP